LLHLAILENANDVDRRVNQFDILRQLLTAAKMSPDVRDEYGHIAALGGFIQAAEILLEHRAKLKELDRFGRTPLMIATKFEIFDVALALLDVGAKIDQPKVGIDRLLLEAFGRRDIKSNGEVASSER
jgi:ankyrin repeat protein